ncbi:hypothetical protein SAMN05519103_00355 [Rhizobiales bacterium GAS113]|nr:hypothetical protein SAMN05519103_00355 [Rhizobiales bacterium GAS113]
MTDPNPFLITTETPSGSTTPGISIVAEQQSSPQRFTIVSDKLTIINQALTNTSNNTVSVPDDGSDEWRVASSAYEEWVPVLLYRHDWKFGTRFQTLSRVGNSQYPGFSDVYEKPGDCLYLQNVYRADLAAMVLPALAYGMPDDDTRPPDLEYRLVQDQIHCVGPLGVIAIYTPFPVGSQPWSVGFVASLRKFIEAGCLRGLNEDFAEATARMKEAEQAFELATSRSDGEEPRRVMFRSSILERRRRRQSGYWP